MGASNASAAVARAVSAGVAGAMPAPAAEMSDSNPALASDSAALAYAVVAMRVDESRAGGVGAVGEPDSAGEAIGASRASDVRARLRSDRAAALAPTPSAVFAV